MLKKVKDYSDSSKDNKDNIKFTIPIFSNQKLLLFLSSGRVLTLDPDLLPGGKASPKSYIELIDVGIDEKLIGIFNAYIHDKLILVTKFGKGFILISKNMITNHKKGKNIINLKKNDELIKIHYIKCEHLSLVSKSEKLLIFDINSLPTLNKGSGVQLIKLKNNDYISDSSLIDINKGLTWKHRSKVRNLKDISLWIGKRAQVGKKIPKFFNKKS